MERGRDNGRQGNMGLAMLVTAVALMKISVRALVFERSEGLGATVWL